MTVPVQKPGKSKQDYQTPRAFLEAVKRRLQIDYFACDLAASAENSVAPKFYDEEMDSLAQSWVFHDPKWSWCNPPFEKIEPWVRKAAEESAKGAHIAMLLPASVGANWWRDWVEPYAYQSFLNGRLAFIPDKPNLLYPKDCALLLYTPWGFVGHEIWNWKGHEPHEVLGRD